MFTFKVFYNTSTTSKRDSLCLGLSSLFTPFCWLFCFVSRGSSTLWWKFPRFDKISLFPWHCLQKRVEQIRIHNIFCWALLHNFFLRLPLTIPLRLHTLWSVFLYLPGCRAPSLQEWPSFFLPVFGPVWLLRRCHALLINNQGTVQHSSAFINLYNTNKGLRGYPPPPPPPTP